MGKNITVILFVVLTMGCTTTSVYQKLKEDTRLLFPIGENGKWGFVDKKGETVIKPTYEEVSFFSFGVSAVKMEGRYGFLKKNGKWHIKPRYFHAENFRSNFAMVQTKSASFPIDIRGKKMKFHECIPRDGGGCKITLPADPNKHTILVNGKYEMTYKYWIKYDSLTNQEFIDTTNLQIDSVMEYGQEHILLKKGDKYGLFDIWQGRRIIIEADGSMGGHKKARRLFEGLVSYKYDDIEFDRFYDNEVSSAKVNIKDKWGVIDSRGNIMLPVEYDSVSIVPGWSMALVEYEKGKFGYKKYSGEEYFKRSQNSRK